MCNEQFPLSSSAAGDFQCRQEKLHILHPDFSLSYSLLTGWNI